MGQGATVRTGDYNFFNGKGNVDYQLGASVFLVHYRIVPAVRQVQFLRCAIPVVRLNYMVRWIQSKNTTIKYG